MRKKKEFLLHVDSNDSVSVRFYYCPHLAFPTAALKQDTALDSGATVLNHSMSLVQRMETLLAMGNGSDVTLRVQTINTDEVKVIQAHSLVLNLQSDVFEELLLTRNNSAVVLRETPDCAAVFDKFVR